MIGNTSKTKAATYNLYSGTIAQGDLSKENSTINIYGPVQIDGEHTFANLTVKNGGTLTSTDYNKYGIYNTNDTSSTANKLFANNNSWRYAYVMRGYINTGTVHDLTYSITSGRWNDADHTKPYNLNPDDFGAIEFFKPVAVGVDPLYDASYWDAANKVGYSYSRYSGSGMVQYQDGDVPADQSTDAKPLIPFELRFINTGGDSGFGVASCSVAPCTTTANNTFIKTLAYNTNFDASNAPELKSLIAWQGDADQSFSTVNSYATMRSWFESAGRYNDDYSSYYEADDYDFQNDKSIVLNNDTNILSDPTIIEVYSAMWVISRTRANFYPTYDNVSPLAHRVGDGAATDYGYPIISRALYQTFRNNGSIVKPLSLNITGTFTLEGGGIVNLNGRGFGSSSINQRGTGPGGGDRDTGASHSGFGGWDYYNNGTPANTYDATASEPTLPGSGAYSAYHTGADRGSYNLYLATNHFQYGGGYIKIVADKINLVSGSVFEANGVGGDVDHPKAGPSGGTIVLIDNSASSLYNSQIMTMGGFCRETSGGNCYHGGGGGGHIFISSKSDLGYLEGRKNYYRHYPANTEAHSTNEVYPDRLFTGADFDFWFYWTLMPREILSVAGGTNEGEFAGALFQATLGSPGLITLNGSSSAYKLKKSLKAISRSNASPVDNFNPYALQLGDRIQVILEASSVANGSALRDYALKVPGKSFECKTVPGSLIPNGSIGTEDGKDFVEWSTTDNFSTYTYLCDVQ